MIKFLLWCILLVICWPLAIIALILYPFIWLITLPFRILGFAINLSFAAVGAIFLFPFLAAGRR
jgi:hypothetical protein